MEKIRLDKFISNQTNISRSIARKVIKQGKVTVDEKTVTDFSFCFLPESAVVTYNGETIGYKEHIYIIMNKPAGILSASNDKMRKTVVDLVPENLYREGLFPVGRLDRDTTGLLIITDDGNFAHTVISPKSGIEKTYLATLDGNFDDKAVKLFKDGVTLADGTVCKSAVLEKCADKMAKITICEGKYHQIKRMFGTIGLGVDKLERLSIGNLTLPPNMTEGKCAEVDKITLKTALGIQF